MGKERKTRKQIKIFYLHCSDFFRAGLTEIGAGKGKTRTFTAFLQARKF